MTHTALTRRQVVAGMASAAAAGYAGCLGDDEDDAEVGPEDPHVDVEAQVDAYVVAYHWGYAAFDAHGDELDLIEVPTNTELTIHAVNDHAYDAIEQLPDPVEAQALELDGLARTKEKVEAGVYPEPRDMTVEEAYEEAHGGGHDHGGHDHDDDGHGDGHDHDDDGHDDGHDHEGGKLDHGFRVQDLGINFQVPADAPEPTTESVILDEPGTYMAQCTVPCGEFHAHQRHDLIRVEEA